MKYLSVCSGIEAASVAWHELGWEPVAFSEIDPFASAVLAARFPHVPNLGNMEAHASWSIKPGSIDVLVGGTPCQSFSVAGLRKGLDDPRGNLALVYLAMVDRLRPRWIIWENVPGVLSSNSGRDFGAFLGGLAQLGYGFAYRVLDAQYVRVESHPRAVPQRRRRVFVVGCLGGDWQRAAEVLLEPEGVPGNSPPRREAGKETARGARPGAASGGIAGTVASKWSKGTGGPAGDACQNQRQELRTLEIAGAIGAIRRGDAKNETLLATPAFPWPVDVADPITAVEGRTYTHEGSNNFRMHNVVPDAVAVCVNVEHALHATGNAHSVRLSDVKDYGGDASVELAPTMRAMPHDGSHPNGGGQLAVAAVHTATMAVRRLTPRECERLQGFPDDWTAIEYRGKPAADGPRYKALGNSMAVNVMRWIGERIDASAVSGRA